MVESMIKVLIVEDNPTEQAAVERLIKEKNLPYDYKVAGSIGEAKNYILSQKFEIIISKSILHDGVSLDLLSAADDIPLIIIAEAGNESAAISSLKGGAANYLFKNDSGVYSALFPVIIENTLLQKRAKQELLENQQHLERLVREKTEALSESAAKYRGLFENSGNPLIFVEDDTTITLCNREFEKLSGYSKIELEGKISWTQLVSNSDDLERMKEYHRLRCVDPTIVPQEYEFEFDDRKGTKRDICVTVAVLPGTRQRLASFLDVTERKRTEKALKKSEEKFLKVFQSIPYSIIITRHSDGKILEVNNIFLQTMGLQSSEAVGKTAAELNIKIAPTSQTDIQNLQKEPDHTVWEETIFYTKVGKMLPAIMSRQCIEINEEVCDLTIIRDITRRKKVEKALSESEAIYRSVFENTGTASIIVEDDTISLVNSEWEKLSGFSREESEGKKSWTEFVAPDDLERMKEYHRNRRIDHLKAPRKYEFHFIKRNGDIRDMINWVALIPGTKKTIVSMMDITDQKQAENKLVEQNSFLELLINHMPNQIFWKDKNLIYRGSNKIFAEVVGIKDPKMIAGKTDFDFERNADYANAYRDTDRQILESGKALFNIEEKYIDSQGNEGEIVTSKIPIKDNSGNTLGILGICVDVTRHKQAEDALRESEKRLSTLIDFSPDATLAIDADKKVIIWNRAIEEMTGISAKDMIGKGEYAYAIPFYGFARPQLIDFFWIAQDELKARYPLLEKEGDSLVIQVFCPGLYNGQGAFVWAKASPLRDSNGQLIGSIECVRDITEGKKAETALRESEEKYRRIVDTANEGIILENSIYQIDFANDRLAEMLGYETTEMIGIQIESILFPEDLADHHKKIEARIQGISEQYERRWRRKDGLAIWTIVSSKPIFDEKGHFSGSFAMITDITVRKKSEEALQESETRFRALFDDNPAMYFIVDTQGIVLAVNSFGASQLGYTIEELVGKPVLNVFYPDDKEAVKQHLIETLKHPMEVVNWEFRKVRKDGSMLWVREAVRAVYAADGQLVVFVVCEDITEQKQKDFELLKAKELAEQSNKLKDGFIANISHEIRTPLNGILGMTSLIHDSFLKYVTKENERFFTAVNKSAKRLMNTVDMIINFSRLKAGDFKIEPILISVSSVIEFLMQVYKSMAAEKSLDIILTNSAWEDMIYADEFSIETALGNIIDNAIKFTDSGAINISVYRNENEKLCVGIADTGIGISQDYLPHLFEPYTQEETGYSRSYEGIGLGLPIVKKLLELNSASITVTSKKDEGTLFTVCFNREFRRQTSTIENNQYTETQTAPSSTLQTEKKYLILIVEDDETNQLLIKSFLHKQYDTFIATNATKALAIMEKQAFDLILMDISLQHGMNGLELTKFIREEKENFNIPIIAVTGHAFPADRRRALEAGCNDYLAKPFTREELLGKVQYFLH